MTSRKHASNRAGVSLAELIIALLLLGTVTTVLVPLLLSLTAQRHAGELRQAALLHAENLLDDFSARPWAEITQEALMRQLTADQSHPSLPSLERSVTVQQSAENDAKQITLLLRWRNRAGNMAAPLRLSGWVFAPLPETP